MKKKSQTGGRDGWGGGGQVEEEYGGSKDKQSEITEAFQLSGFEPGRKIFSLLRW